MIRFRTGLGAMVSIVATLALAAAPVHAQIETIDPNAAYGDPAAAPSAPASDPAATGSAQGVTEWADVPAAEATPVAAEAATAPAPEAAAPAAGTDPAAASGTTFHEAEVVSAAEGVFGKGAQGLARMIQDLLKKQGEPNGYIVGREGGGAFVLGVRYGSGTLYHKVEGKLPVFWTGPSVGLDVGANAGDTFVLVYNLYDTQELYKRFGAGEGQAYLVGGFHVSYLRRGDVVLIPVRMGVGLRLGVNTGYMKFTRKQNWLPF